MKIKNKYKSVIYRMNKKAAFIFSPPQELVIPLLPIQHSTAPKAVNLMAIDGPHTAYHHIVCVCPVSICFRHPKKM